VGKAGDELVGGLAGSLPVAVVIDERDAMGHDLGVKVGQLVPRRLVPVGVEAQERDPGG
jgi:hypothetical protein